MSSVIDQLREKRKQAAARTTVDLDVPGYRGAIVARYRLLDPLTEGKEIGDRIKNQFDDDESRMHYGAVDSLIAACDGLYLRENGQLEPIDPDGNGPAQYDHRLAAALGLEDQTAREIVAALFNGNNVAVMAHSLELSRWMADPSRLPGEA